ncbi:putative nitrite reductase [Virgisporangium aliadipatigenens]|uniref:assimilatory sulfite reductase (ferredoxin) n=1 Tax=Virgisporangium aliadipatigenens TaxID=741659 RepID=A0A8J3YGB0_9ACTN|nr:nitrite reductase large subunit NirB [Virgisporangium aliadipatigenens]GIJ44714.1 putative nitrite reductase [Virgisporangium aliadipatigenens]
MKLVVVGHGMVGQRLLESLAARAATRDWEITVLAEETRRAYDRVRLSAYFDGVSAEELSYDVPAGVDLRLGEPALAIDPGSRKVTTAREMLTYDALVLATGSYPFVPPVEGADRPGVFVYRTLDDLERIREYAAGKRVGAVIGGGLLGLEAANALRLLGLATHVVEFAPRLMPLQVDEAGGAVLKQYVEELGVVTHLGAATTAIRGERPGSPANGLVLSTGAWVPADIVVIAAGVRPRDDLARGAGLPVGARGGVIVDDGCRTADPAVYAIGEVAEIGGRCYGLVAPGYAMAEVVADRLLGGAATFPGADTSTKLKLLGVDVASFGDALTPDKAATDRLDVVYLDPANKVYAKLVLSDDARTLLGGVLVGDASAYPTLRASLGGELPAAPLTLLAPAGEQADISLPGTAQVCTCNAVTKDQVLGAIAEGCCDVPAIKSCTRAGTSCGSCVPLLKQLLAEAGVVADKSLCEHFSYSRAELFDIVKVRGLRTFSQVITEHGTGGRGCDICKPVVASILASLHNEYILDGEQAALQDTNDHFLANMQRNGTYSVVPRIPGGEITPEKLIAIGEVARDFDLYTKITGGQRIDLFGARVEQLPQIWQRLIDAGFESGHAYGKALRTIKSCVGSTWCRYGVQDSVGLAIALELRYRGLRAPHKIKSAVSGCARECAEAKGKDFGIIATEAGWNLYVGGNGGFRPRHADLLASDLTTEELIRYVDRFLMFYIRTADRLQRTSAWIEAVGLDYVREVIVADSLGIAGELDAMMAQHIGSYHDEWKATLDDPVRLSRFVSFVNAPETPDPTIQFTRERGQIVPLQIGTVTPTGSVT